MSVIKSFKKFLLESVFTKFNLYGKELAIYKNPTPIEINAIYKTNPYKCARAVIFENGDVYMVDGEFFHSKILHKLRSEDSKLDVNSRCPDGKAMTVTISLKNKKVYASESYSGGEPGFKKYAEKYFDIMKKKYKNFEYVPEIVNVSDLE